MPNIKRSATVEWCMHWSEYAEKKGWKPYTLGKINWAAAMAYEQSIDVILSPLFFQKFPCEFLGFRIARYLASLNLEVGGPSFDTFSAAHCRSISCFKKKKNPQTTKPTWNKIPKHKVILYSAVIVFPSLRIKIGFTFAYKWACFTSKHAGWWGNYILDMTASYFIGYKLKHGLIVIILSCSCRLYLKRKTKTKT